MELFKVGLNDYTNNIINGPYAVDEEPVCDEWVDGRGVTHKSKKRDKISGTFTMKFRTLAEYTTFANLIKTSTESGQYVECTVFLNKKQETRTKNFFIEWFPVASQKSNLVYDYGEITITISEA